MSADSITEYLADVWSPLGRVTHRKMFGGAGVYIDGVIVGLLADELYLKADAGNAAAFDADGLPPFTYEKNGKPYAMSYRLAPSVLYDDPEQALRWGRLALEAALRSAARKRVKA
jgi:DNA transformation protein and related proteins